MTDQSTGKQLSPAAQFHDQLTKLQPQFIAALPRHIPVDRFMRVVQTAVNGNPDLMGADRRTLFESAMKAAQDGLLPDGREGALVIYNAKAKVDGQDRWIKKVQWMPMILGIMKKVRNSGEIVATATRVVYEGDRFRAWIDDDGQHIEFESIPDHNEDNIRGAFAMAKTKDGEVMVEYMTAAQIEKVRSVSRAKDSGPWVQWWEEMARKTVFRRLAKSLPMSTDADDLIRRDDDLYDFKSRVEQVTPSASEQFRALATNPLDDGDEGPRRLEHGAAPMTVDADEDERPEPEPVREKAAPRQRKASAPPPDTRSEPVDDLPEPRGEDPGEVDDDPRLGTRHEPREEKPAPASADPTNAEGYQAHLAGWLRAEGTVEGVKERWKAERRLRTKLLAGIDDLDKAEKLYHDRLNELAGE